MQVLRDILCNFRALSAVWTAKYLRLGGSSHRREDNWVPQRPTRFSLNRRHRNVEFGSSSGGNIFEEMMLAKGRSWSAGSTAAALQGALSAGRAPKAAIFLGTLRAGDHNVLG